MADRLEAGRRAFGRRSWSEAYRALQAECDELGPADLERLAIAAYLVGEDDACLRALDAAYRGYVTFDDPAEAARCAFWHALVLLLGGEMAQANGWLARAETLIEATGAECAASGYLLVPAFLMALESGDAATALDLGTRTLAIGRRVDDPDLVALGLLSLGESLVALGRPVEGVDRLDEVMLSVTAGETGPITTGIVYCAVVLECMKLYDLARAAEWTRALTAWCDSQPDLVPFRGQCLVHRSQLEQAAGNWRDAVAAAQRACELLSDPPHPAVGLAYYQAGELHRLAGDLGRARAAYREAHHRGHQPLPGLALLELVEGDAAAAAATIRRALGETVEPMQRPGLLAAAVDIHAAAGDVPSGRAAADELRDLASGAASTVLRAMADRAVGTMLMAESDPGGALTHLRAAAGAWQQLRMPYEGARTAVVLAQACTALGDQASATLEVDRAAVVFTELGAARDLERLPVVPPAAGPPAAGARASPLSAREVEVLALVAAGRTNRQIATDLTISEHTVGRHLENIFAKLGVSSRAAATASAYEHGLL
jgi:DNA-binding CsgD family transcriptional regulator/tetratricopeptide (TPR) repeat protein